MWIRGTIFAASLALGLSLVACKKDDKKPAAADPAPAPGAPGQTTASGAALTAPPLFAYIPADSPYVFASFQPIPRDFWTLIGDTFGADIERVLDDVLARPATEPGERFLHGLVRELRGNLSADGLKKVAGISTDVRFVVHGVGLLPVVRLELADPKALRATLEKLTKESGFTLPMATANGKPYYRLPAGSGIIVAAILEDHLVIGGGPTAMVDKALPFILGAEKPQPSMADGGALKEVVARHGFSPYGAGFVDSAKLLNILMVSGLLQGVSGGSTPPPACLTEATSLAARFPRVVFGYDDLSSKAIAMRFVGEMEAGLLGRVKAVTVDVPGMTDGKLAEPALFAVGAAVDIAKARELALAFASATEQIGTACQATNMIDDAREMKETLSQPLPPGVDKIRGGLVAVLGAEMGQGGPTDVNAFGFVASDDPGALIDLALAQLPQDKAPKIARDGAFHDVMPAGAVPGLGAIQAAVKPKAAVVAVGPRGVAGAEAALARTGKAPLLFLSYDYGRILKLGATALGQMGASIPGLSDKVIRLLGQSTMWAYVSDQGVAMAFRMEMRR